MHHPHRTPAEEADHLLPQAAAAPQESAWVAAMEDDHHPPRAAEAGSAQPAHVREHAPAAQNGSQPTRTAMVSLAEKAGRQRR